MNTHSPKHVVFSGGGTGGHLFPALAVAERLVQDAPGVRITIAGSGRDFERRHVAAAGLEYVAVRCSPLPRRPWRLPAFLADNLAGYRKARSFLRHEEVDVVVGLGGFASVPMARAAIDCRVPLVLLEQNVLPGRATRWLAPSADAVCLAFEQSRARFRPGCKLRVTGNPIRAGFVAGTRRVPSAGYPGSHASAWEPELATLCVGRGRYLGSATRSVETVRSHAEAWERGTSKPQLLILGGSGGARSLNENVPRGLWRLGRDLKGWSIVHQTGPADWDTTRRLYRRLGVPATVVRFVSDMPGLLQRTALAVCRAGGTTLAELAATGVPSVLVPYPHAADDHQRHNAEAYSTAGGCLILDDRECMGGLDSRLTETLGPLLTDARLRSEMSCSMSRLARPHAADEVADVILATGGICGSSGERGA